MALASDLMGLGVAALQAQRTANAGLGPLTITAAGSAFASATRLGCSQYLTSCGNASGTNGIALPLVGTDNGCLLGDDFIINNLNSTNSLLIFTSTGVALSVGGSNNSGTGTSVQVHTTLTCFPISTTQWIGVRGS